MGFRASAGWAQCLTDAVVARAALPEERRVVANRDPPADFPLWGTIIDDIWAIDQDNGDIEATEGLAWIHAAENEWTAAGVDRNERKDVDNAVHEEIQGFMVDGERHSCGA
eukprot:4740433-Lingulodinium_polyedra.AAC.1